MQDVRMYLGVPQTSKLSVRTVSGGYREIIKQLVLTNTDKAASSKLTVTINTVDVKKDLTLVAGETKVIDMYQVLEPGDTVFLQQEKENVINCLISGVTAVRYNKVIVKGNTSFSVKYRQKRRYYFDR